MTKGPLKSVILATLIAIAMTTVGVPNASAQDGWEFDLAIYAWLPTIEGKLAYDLPGSATRSRSTPPTCSKTSSSPPWLSFAARHDRWSILGDVIYLKEAASRNRTLDIGDGINLRADFELKSWITNFAGAYDVARSERSTLGVLVGVRYFSMDTRLVAQQ